MQRSRNSSAVSVADFLPSGPATLLDRLHRLGLDAGLGGVVDAARHVAVGVDARRGLRNASSMDPPPSDGTDRSADAGGDVATVSGSASLKPITAVGNGSPASARPPSRRRGVAWACLRWKPCRVEIEGGSMAPTLAPGDWALVARPSRYERGDVVVVEHPGRPGYEMVKRTRRRARRPGRRPRAR